MTVKLPILSGDGAGEGFVRFLGAAVHEGLTNLPNAFPPRRTPVPQPDDPRAVSQIMGFFTDASLCIGCKACEVACKQWNQLPASEMHWMGSSYDNTGALSATTWRHVQFIEQVGRLRPGITV